MLYANRIASVASPTYPRLLTAEEFLQIDFGANLKAELDHDVIRMMARATLLHNRIQMNIGAYLRTVLRGSGCRPYGSDMAIRTHDMSMRYPDVSVECSRHSDPDALVLASPRVLIEVLSPSTRDFDLGTKAAEYRAVSTVDAVAFVDPDARTLCVNRRIETGWTDPPFSASDLHLPSLGVTIPHAEIFAND